MPHFESQHMHSQMAATVICRALEILAMHSSSLTSKMDRVVFSAVLPVVSSTSLGMKLKGGGMSTCTSMRPFVMILGCAAGECCWLAKEMATSRLKRSLSFICVRMRCDHQRAKGCV